MPVERETIGRYRILSQLGEGGMGVVYAAHDDRLDRPVAIKMIHAGSTDTTARQRLWREARAAARVSHPNICQLYEIDEENGELYLVMELLDGRPLAARVAEGPMPLDEAGPVALAILGALDSLHRQGIVHRDLKPSNVFLTPHGVKLLDFGLAYPTQTGDVSVTDLQLTRTGTTVGTPRYMAPEQWGPQPVDARADLFVAGGLLYEMLTGKPAFPGSTMLEVYHAIVHEQPPALAGSPAIVAVDRLIHRSLAKAPADRYPDAESMALDLRAALRLLGSRDNLEVRTVTRLIVLPFRILRPDSDIDFLAFSLPDAVTSTLSGLETLVVRSSIAASRYADGVPDLKRIASEADVDVVLTGTLMRAGDQVRVSTQLVEAPTGTLLWSKTSQVPLGDLFQLQDDLAHQIVQSLSLPLSARESRLLQQDTPATAKAYEFYLRANQLAMDTKTWDLALELYRQCLEEDPRYAPAWARLGRVHRVMAKYTGTDARAHFEQAESAFRRSLELNPDLSIAHTLYAQFEVEEGRTKDALVRLLERARTRSADPDLFIGLVHACRYAGLLEASIAADRQALRLDPGAKSSVCYTYWAAGDFERAIATEIQDPPYMLLYALPMLDRVDEAIDVARRIESTTRLEHTRLIAASHRALLEGHREEALETVRQIVHSPFKDPEGLYFETRTLARLDAPAEAIQLFTRVVDGGFYCYPLFLRDPWLDSLRANAEFSRTLARAESLHHEASEAFLAAGGREVLGGPGI